MAVNITEFTNLTEADKSSKLYKWMMTAERPENPSSDFLKEVFDEQSSYYDQLFCDRMGWYCWKEGAEVLNDQMERSGFKKDGCIIDAGSGTGLVGQRLSELGYTNITALDISRGMLDQCKDKGCYNRFLERDLNTDTLEDFKNTFDAVVAIGIFARYLVKPHGLRTLINCAKKGGIMCISFRAEHYELYDFKEMCEKLIGEGSLKQVGRQDTAQYFQQGMNGHFFTYQVL